MDELEVPQHVQQLQQLASLLQKDKAESDSVTWVADLIPQFVQKAVVTVCSQAGDQNGEDSTAAAAHDSANHPMHNSTDLQLTSDNISTHTAPTAPAAALAIGTQHAQFTSSSKRPVCWLMTTCLVPEGMPTAAAAEDAGGLATLEVVCRLLMLQDCQPAAATPALEKAIKKVKWHQYGLQYKEYFSRDDTGTGIITLGVLPDAVMVPLSLIVCCCNSIEASQGGADTDEPAASVQDQTDSAQAQDTATKGSKRKRGGVNRAAAKAPTLSMRREMLLWVSAFDAALLDLKAQLPGGYMRGKHEALLAAALPPIALSLANIMARAANAHFRQQSCRLLGCEPAELQETLLTQLEDLAAGALAYKTAAANQQQRKQAPLSVDTAAAAAALLAAEYPDLDQHAGDGQQELPGDQHAQQTPPGHTYREQDQHAQHGHMYQEQGQHSQQTQPGHMQEEQQWQGQQQRWPHMQADGLAATGHQPQRQQHQERGVAGLDGLAGKAQQQQDQHQKWGVAGCYGVADASAGAWGAEPPFSNSQQEGTLGQVSMWQEDQQQQQQSAGHQGWVHAAGKGRWEAEQVCADSRDDGQQQDAWGVGDRRTAWPLQSQQVPHITQQQQQQGMVIQAQTQQQYDAWGMLSRQDSAGPQQDWHAAAVEAPTAVGLRVTQGVGDMSHGTGGNVGVYGGDVRLQESGGAFGGASHRPATGPATAPANPRPSGRRRMSGSVAASLF